MEHARSHSVGPHPLSGKRAVRGTELEFEKASYGRACGRSSTTSPGGASPRRGHTPPAGDHWPSRRLQASPFEGFPQSVAGTAGSTATHLKSSSSAAQPLVLTLPEALAERSGRVCNASSRVASLAEPVRPLPRASKPSTPLGGSRSQVLQVHRYSFGADKVRGRDTSPLRPRKPRTARLPAPEPPVDDNPLFATRPVGAAPIPDSNVPSPSMVLPPRLPSSPSVPGCGHSFSGGAQADGSGTCGSGAAAAHGAACARPGDAGAAASVAVRGPADAEAVLRL